MAVENNRLGVWLFVLSDSVFFALLILAYVFFRWEPGVNVSEVLDPWRAGIFAGFLFASAATMWLAVVSGRRGRDRQMLLWLGVTVLFGMVFLAGQSHEAWVLIHQGITIRQSLFGSTFYTVTGFHEAHVAVGLVILLILGGIVLRGRPQVVRRTGLPAASIYWYFMAVGWLFIYSIVYLWGAYE